jgi:hypothetical protein
MIFSWLLEGEVYLFWCSFHGVAKCFIWRSGCLIRLFNICTDFLGGIGGYVIWSIFRVFLSFASLQAFHQPSQNRHSLAQGDKVFLTHLGDVYSLSCYTLCPFPSFQSQIELIMTREPNAPIHNLINKMQMQMLRRKSR